MKRSQKFAVMCMSAITLFAFTPSIAAAKPPQGESHEASTDNVDNHHPSGKDRTVENGNSGTQGKSTNEPDDNGKGPERDFNNGPGDNDDGLADKPGQGGGMHLDDQDGNNGCGNDDDFEDDNEGWCGQKPAPVTTPSISERPEEPPAVNSGTEEQEEEAVTPEEPETNEEPVIEDDVLGETFFPTINTPEPEDVVFETVQKPERTEVASVNETRRPSSLAATGASVLALALLGAGTLITGLVLTKRTT